MKHWLKKQLSGFKLTFQSFCLHYFHLHGDTGGDQVVPLPSSRTVLPNHGCDEGTDEEIADRTTGLVTKTMSWRHRLCVSHRWMYECRVQSDVSLPHFDRKSWTTMCLWGKVELTLCFTNKKKIWSPKLRSLDQVLQQC